MNADTRFGSTNLAVAGVQRRDDEGPDQGQLGWRIEVVFSDVRKEHHLAVPWVQSCGDDREKSAAPCFWLETLNECAECPGVVTMGEKQDGDGRAIVGLAMDRLSTQWVCSKDRWIYENNT